MTSPDSSPAWRDSVRRVGQALQPSRRTFLRTAGLLAAGTVTGGLYAYQVEPQWVEWTQRRLFFPGLPNQLRGRVLVQVSDLHVGPRVTANFVRNALLRTAELDPDWVVYTGDFVTWRGDWVLDELREALQGTLRGRRGTFAVLGNHDYGRRWSDVGIAGELTALLREQGIEVLRNRWVASDGMVFAGVEDYWSRRYNVWQALAGRPSAPTVMLCHNPDVVNLEGWNNFEGWVLSGHTHGGQVRVPFWGAPIVPVDDRRFVAGHVEIAPNRHLYINRALGHGLPVRFGVRPEITVFTVSENPA